MLNFSTQLMRVIVALILVFSGGVMAGFPTPTDPFEIPQGAYQAEFVRDLGHVAQIRFAGDYNRNLPDESFNIAARAAVAQEFYKNHSDDYDILFVFTDFPIEMGDAVAFQVGVKNSTKGIGQRIHDLSNTFGSDGKLASYIDFSALENWEFNVTKNEFNGLMATTMHEIMHRWVTGVQVMEDGKKNDILKGHNGYHWSALLDTDASVMFGADWTKTADSTYLASSQRERYSALDLYMAGFYAPEEVGVIQVIDSPDIGREALWTLGASIKGTEKQFSVADIIAAEGERIPSYKTSQKRFKAGIVLLTSDFTLPNTRVISELNQFGEQAAIRFAHLTGGRGFIHVANTSQNEQKDSDEDTFDVRDNVNTDLALFWLKEQQNAGYWKDTEYTQIRDSVTANKVLRLLDEDYSESDFRQWLNSVATAASNDDRAFLAAAGEENARDMLSVTRNPDGGWGLRSSFTSTVFDTATILDQMPVFRNYVTQTFILEHRNSDGGWPREREGISDFKTTAMVFSVLSKPRLGGGQKVDASVLNRAAEWLFSYLENNKSSKVSPADLAIVLSSVSRLDVDMTHLSALISQKLSTSQQSNGSWGDSSHSTSMVLEAFASSKLPNLVISGDDSAEHNITAGAPVNLNTLIANDGAIDAATFTVGLYLNEVASDHLLAEQTISSLASGTQRSLNWIWESGTQLGNQRLIVSVDNGRQVSEKTKADNVLFRDVSVLVPSADANLAVFSADIKVIPDFFDSFTEQLEVLASIRNLSTVDIGSARVSLWAGNGLPEKELAQQITSVAAGAHQPVKFNVTTEYYKNLFVRVESADDKYSIDNQARINLNQKGALDFSINSVTLNTQPPFDFGQNLEFDILVSDLGTTASPSISVSLIIQKDGQIIKTIKHNMNISSGEQRNNRFEWRPDASGDYVIIASVDDDNLIAETNETNNQAQLPITVSLSDKANLNITYRDIKLTDTIRQGSTAEFKVTVRNTGKEDSNATTLQLFHGKPNAGGKLISEIPLSTLTSEQSLELQVFWDDVAAEGQELVYVRLDPNNDLDEASESDNEAFIEVNIEAMPDLFISNALIKLSPSIVTAGTPVAAEITIANTGGQEIRDVEFEVKVDGKSIGYFPIASISEYTNIKKTVNLDTSALTSTAEILVVLDPENNLKELREENNQASTQLVIGSSDLYISEPFISPDGNGVKDSAELFAKFNPAAGQSLVVRDTSGNDIATFPADASFPMTWYGSVNGRRLDDGEYTLNIVNQNKQVELSVSVVIDINAISVAEALESDFKIQYFYREIFGDIAWLSLYDDEQRIVFSVKKSEENQRLIPGIYTADFAGGGARLIMPYDDNEFDFISLSSDETSILVNSSNLNQRTYARIDLVTNSYNPIYLDDGSRYWSLYGFWYEYNKVIYGIYYTETSVSLMQVNPENADTQVLSEAINLDYMGYHEKKRFPLSIVDVDTLVFRNTVVSFSEEKIYAYSGKGIAYHAGTVAQSTESGGVIISALDGSDSTTFPEFSDRNLQNALQYAEFNDNKTKLMLYLVDPERLPLIDPPSDSSGEWPARELVGFYDHTILFDTTKNQDTEEPRPNGYRVELDLNTGEYSLRSYFSRFVTLEDWWPYTVEHEESFSSIENIKKTFYRYGWEEYTVAFEGHETGGHYLSKTQYLDKSLYLNEIIEAVSGGGEGPGPGDDEEDIEPTTTDFFPFAIDIRGETLPRPFATGFIFESLNILNSGSILFGNTEKYNTKEAKNTIPIDRKYQVSDALFLNTLNLSAYLKFSYDDDNQGVGLQVLAMDKNFDNYEIDYRLEGQSGWSSIVSATKQEERNEFVTTWVPPSEGTYTVRLRVRDKAGNQRQFSRELIWSYGANITNIILDSDVFSPNSDNISDTLNINFNILRPSNLPFVIQAMDGTPVLERILSVDQIGEIGLVSWDGRNAGGQRVPDGTYKIYIDGYLYYVVVDTSPPKIENCSNPVSKHRVRVADANPAEYISKYYGIICAIAEDENTVKEQYYEYLSGSSWELLIPDIKDVQLFSSAVDVQSFSSINVFDSISYRYVAVDEAGNRTITEPLENILSDILHIVDITHEEILVKKIQLPEGESNRLYVYVDTEGKTLLEYRYSTESTVLKLGYIDANGNNVETDTTVPASWNQKQFTVTHVSLKSAYEKAAPKGNEIYYYISDGDQVTRSVSFYYFSGEIFSIELDDENENDVLSYKITDSASLGPVSYDVVISSQDSNSRYSTPFKIHHADAGSESYSLSHQFWDLPLEYCVNYKLSFIFEDGRVEDKYYRASCAEYFLEPSAPAAYDLQCNAVSDKLFYTIEKNKNTNADTGTENIAVFAVKSQSPNQRVYLYSASNASNFSVEKSKFPVASDWYLFLEITYTNGSIKRIAQGRVASDNYIPTVTIHSPLPNQTVCAKSDPEKYPDLSWVEIQGAMIDYGGVDDSYRITADFNKGKLLSEDIFDCISSYEGRHDDTPKHVSEICEKVSRTTSVGDGGRKGILRQGLLDVIFNGNGPQNLSYVVSDQGNNTACGSIDYTVDGYIQFSLRGILGKKLKPRTHEAEMISPYGLSPNGDGQYDDLVLTLNVLEDVHLKVALGQTEISSSKIVAGTTSLVIPGEKITAPDGVYQLKLIATDDCGFIYENSIFNIEIDTRVPDVSILYPGPDDELFPVTGIKVDLFDRNAGIFNLDFKSEDSENWIHLNDGSKNLYAEIIHDLILGGIEGGYQIRLSAEDELANYSETINEINVTTLGTLLSSYRADDIYVSPNNDGVKDALLGDVVVSRKATVNFILNEQIVHTTPSLAAGDHEWAIPMLVLEKLKDGAYTLKLTAIDAANESRTESGSLEFIVDKTAPVLTVDSKLDGHLGILSVEVNDIHMSEFRYELVNDNDKTVLKSVETDFLQSSTPFVIEMTDDRYTEGKYTLTYSLLDKAGNQKSGRYDFIFDTQAPVLVLDGASLKPIVFNQKNTPFTLSFTYDERFPESLQLKLKDQVLFTKAELVPSIEGSEVPMSEVISLEAYSDAIYSLKLSMKDIAGNEGMIPVGIQLDSSAPKITIVRPSDLDPAYIRPESAFEVVIDDNSALTGVVIIAGDVELSSLVNRQAVNWPTDLADGSYEVSIRVSDAADNESELTRTFIQDSIAPAVITLVTAENDNGVTRVSWSASTSNDVKIYHVYRDGELISKTESIGIDDLLSADGRYEYYVTVVDFAGNESAESIKTVLVIDTTGPEVVIVSPKNNSVTGGSIAFSGDVIADDLAIVTATVETNGQVFSLSSSALSGDKILFGEWDSSEFNGIALFRIVATDETGNTTDISHSITLDNISPVAPTGLTVNVNNGNTTSATWQPVQDEQLAGYQLWRSGSDVSGDLLVTQFTETDLPDGSYRYAVVSLDVTGNLSAPSKSVAITIDNRAPDLKVIQPQPSEEFEHTLNIEASFTDHDVVKLEMVLKDDAAKEVATRTLTFSPFSTVFDTAELAFGAYDLTLTATDATGNISTAIININKSDLTPPEAVSQLVAINKLGSIRASWIAVDADDVDHYEMMLLGPLDSTPQDLTVVTTEGEFTSIDNSGIYIVRVYAVDDAGNRSLPMTSEEVPYHRIATVFPYSPVSTDSAMITVSGGFAGDVSIHTSDAVLLSIPINKNMALELEQDLTTKQTELAIHAKYDTGNSVQPISYQLVRGDKPDTPDVLDLVLKEEDQITVALTSALDAGEVWFLKRNGHLEEGEEVFSGNIFEISGLISSEQVTEIDIEHNSWIGGFLFEYLGGELENRPTMHAEVWNGVNWMRMPFTLNEDASVDIAEFEFPVNTSRIRIKAYANDGRFHTIGWAPLAARVHTAASQVVIPDIMDDLNGVDAVGLSVTATAVSAMGVIGDESAALSLDAHSDSNLPEVVLKAELVNGSPVLSWETTAGEYQRFYLQHNQLHQQEVAADGSGVYKIIDPKYRDGLNQYQVIAVTADGRTKSSQQIDISLTLDIPLAVTNLTAVVNSLNNSVELSWGDTQTDMHYEVYRKHLLQTEFNLIYSGTELEFIDAKVQANSIYRYYVVAVNKGEKSGTLSNIVVVTTLNTEAGLSPKILLPKSGNETTLTSQSVLIAALPQQQLLLSSSDNQSAGVMTPEIIGRVVSKLDDNAPRVGYSNLWAATRSSGLINMYSGEAVEWLAIGGSGYGYLQKNESSAYIHRWGTLWRYQEYSPTLTIARNVVQFDVALNDSLLAVTDNSKLIIRYGEEFSNTVMLDDVLATSFARGQLSVSDDGNFVAVFRGDQLKVIDVTERTQPSVVDLSATVTTAGDPQGITWLSNDRLAIIGDSVQITNTLGELQYELSAEPESTLKFLGYYSDYLVVASYNDAAAEQEIKVYSSGSGQFAYQFTVATEKLSYQMNDDFISGYGLICSPENFSIECRLLPGMTEVDVHLQPARNEIVAVRNLPDGRQLRSNVVIVHRDAPGISNAELVVSEKIRSLGRASDIDIELRHNSGGSVSIEGITLFISQPDGTVEEIIVSDISVTLEPGEIFNHQYLWTPDQNGQYSIEVKADINDDISNDNTVVFNAVIAEVGDPRIGLSAVSEQHIDIALNTFAYEGDATMVIRMNSYRGEEQFILAEEVYGAYTAYEYQYVPSDLDVWNYGFELIAELHSDGLVIAQQSLDIEGDLLVENLSEVNLRLNRNEVTAGLPATLTYTLEINTSAVFNGALTITATHQSGTQTMLTQLPLAYLFDGEVVEQVLVISDALLAPGNYQITASLSDNKPQVIDTASVALTVNEAPVRYSGSLSSADTVIGMGAELSLDVNITGSLSNTPENIAIYLIADDMSDLKLADINSAALPYVATIDLSSLTASLGDKLIRLKVVPENRSAQFLSEITLNIIDIVPPILNVLSPVNNGFINEYSVAEVAANDAHSGIDRVQLSVGSSEPRSLLRADATYNASLSDLVEGQHQLNVSAYDVAGNFTRFGPINVTMDKTAPQLILTGVTDGAVYSEPVSINIAATDIHLETTKLSVNGAVSLTDSLVISDDGAYRIVAEAVDKAGNRTLKSLSFVLDQTAPVITVSGVQDGAIYTEGVSYGITVEDSDVSTLIVRINDSDMPASGDISDDGMYSLSVTATDRAGNSATVLISFLIDSTAPELPLISISDGQQFENALIPLTGSGESGSRFRMRLNDALSEILITDDGFSLDLTLIEGLNTVEYWAVDAAGNESGHVVISISLISLPEFELVAQENPLVRTLVWVPWYDKHSDETEEFVRTAMDSHGTEYHISTSENDFREQLRSQRYTVAVLMHTSHIIGLPSGFSVSLSSELRAMVAQGMGLVTVSNQLSLFDIWEDVYGINDSRSDVKALGFTLNDEILGNYELALSGIGSRVYVESDATGLGDFEVKCLTIFHCREISEGQYPGLIDHYYGLGRVMTSGFDLADAIPSADSARLLRSMINKVAPKHINGFSYQWRALDIVSASGAVNNLNVTIRYDESFASVFVNNSSITSGESFVLNMKQELMVRTTGTFAAHIELDITYNDEFVRTETLIFESPLSSYEADWQALITFADDMDVAWYKVPSYLIMKHDLENARATNVSNQIDVDYVRVRLVNALLTTKVEFSDQSEAFALLAGKLLLELESKQVD